MSRSSDCSVAEHEMLMQEVRVRYCSRVVARGQREVRSVSYAEQDLLARGAGTCPREVRVLGLARGQWEVRSILYGMQSRDQ